LAGEREVFQGYLEGQGFTLQQREAILASRNLIVEAGAGTGKTKTLVARYLRHVLVDGFSPQEVVALTFTEKAAQEMRERVQDQLAQFQGSRLEGRAMKAMEVVIQAPIKTFHGFSSYLLREYPVETWVDPAFSLLDEMGEVILLEETINGYLATHLEASPLSTLLAHWNIFQLKRALMLFFTSVFSEVGLEEVEGGLKEAFSPPTLPLEEVLDRVREAVEKMEEVKAHLSQGHCTGLFARLLSSLETLDYLLSIRGEGEDLPGLIIRVARELDHFPQWGRCSHLEELKALRDFSHHLWQWLEKEIGEGFYRAFLALVRGIWGELERVKVREGVLTFSDLQRRLVGALRTNGPFREELKGRFRRLLVDEYQDTNELQREIVTHLSEVKGETSSHYQEALLEDGKLFVVGDPKQSIYAFRGADVAVYARTKRHLGTQGSLALTRCFRSGEGLVEKGNALFQRVFQDVSPLLDPDYGVPFTPLDTEEKGGEVWLWWLEEGMDQNEALARLILRAKREGYGWGDIGVLLRRNATVIGLFHYLSSRGIPVVSSTAGELLERREVQDVFLYLKALDNPADNFSVLGILVAPFVGVDKATVLALSSRGKGLYQAWKEAVDEKSFSGEKGDTLAWALDIFEGLRDRKDRLTISGLIQEVVRKTGYGWWLSQQPYGEQALANVDGLSREARRFQKGRLFTLSEFLISVENKGLPSRETQEEMGMGDAVALLTVHAAKGLEFPVVVLGETWLLPRKAREPVLYDTQRGLALRIPDLDFSPPYQQVKVTKDQKGWEEEKRLLYVAFTRTRKELHILFTRERKRGESWQSQLLSAGVEALAKGGEWAQTPKPKGRVLDEAAQMGEVLLPQPLEHSLGVQVRVGVGGLLPGDVQEGNPILGIFFHKALREMTHPKEGGRWFDLHQSPLVTQGVFLTKRRFLSKIRAYFESDFYRDVVAPAKRVFRELSLEAPFGSLLLAGRPDILVITQEGKVVVGEYKLERNMLHGDRYLSQLALYSWLVEGYTGQWPDTVYLYYILSGEEERMGGGPLRDRALALLDQGIIKLNRGEG
jgi:ATP-dependent helicase/nuclease subunit A